MIKEKQKKTTRNGTKEKRIIGKLVIELNKMKTWHYLLLSFVQYE